MICKEYNVHTVRQVVQTRATDMKSSHIVIKTIRIKKRTLVDVVIRSNKNTSTKVSEKLSKYEDLQIEITRMWQMKTEITTGSQVRYELILDASAVL